MSDSVWKSPFLDAVGLTTLDQHSAGFWGWNHLKSLIFLQLLGWLKKNNIFWRIAISRGDTVASLTVFLDIHYIKRCRSLEYVTGLKWPAGSKWRNTLKYVHSLQLSLNTVLVQDQYSRWQNYCKYCKFSQSAQVSSSAPPHLPKLFYPQLIIPSPLPCGNSRYPQKTSQRIPQISWHEGHHIDIRHHLDAPSSYHLLSTSHSWQKNNVE